MDYLLSKYGDSKEMRTMKEATNKYADICESEVSTKTTLRSLQYRLNRIKEEQKQKEIREELERKKLE